MVENKKIKKNSPILGILGLVVAAVAVVILVMGGAFYTPDITDTDSVCVYVGGTNINEYKIVSGFYPVTGKAAKTLKKYISNLTGETLGVSPSKGDGKYIEVKKCKNGETSGITIKDGNITISGNSSKEILENVELFANIYLGWSFAGEEREHILDNNGECHIPENVTSLGAGAWIAEREPIVTLWKTNVPRGQWENTDANMNSEVLQYTDDQLYQYIKMMKYCGYTGIQVTDMCSTWAQYDGYEYVQERLRFMADSAHSLGMNFTLWVWGAEFTGYGWVDTSVVYNDPSLYTYSYECPEALETFNKYYSIYAQLADCSDRVVMHFDDPSNVHTSEEVAFYGKMFHDMVKEINPDIKFCISDYTNKYDKQILGAAFDDELTILGGAVKATGDSWVTFRGQVVNAGCKVGVWCWDLTGREIDQLSGMYVNNSLIKQVYQNTKNDADSVVVPEYWSEMDAYHVMNVYSLYASGHLLQNPDMDENELLFESAYATVGPEYAEDFTKILELVALSRTGNSWEEYNWAYGDYLLRSDKYPAESILNQCEEYIPILDEMIEKDLKDNTLPLPISVTELLKMIKTQLVQIQEFAQYRVDLQGVINDLNSGEDKEKIESELAKIYKPISNYDAVVGVWGQVEALAQYKLLTDFCTNNDIQMPDVSEYTDKIKEYIYSEMVSYQKCRDYQMLHGYGNMNVWNIVVGQETYDKILEELIEEGLVARTEEGWAYLTNWEELKAQ